MKGSGLPVVAGLFLLLTGAGYNMQKAKTITYLPLGDSYTICTGAKTEESWPVLLSRHLTENGINCQLPANPARNGYTSQNLIDLELPICREQKPGFVTVLIGVNDWVRGVPEQTFHKNLAYILSEVKNNLAPGGRMLLVTIPDFGVTPEGKNYANGRDISKGISGFNAIIRHEAANRQIPVVDIFELSKKMGEDESLVAPDGLHPSAKEYAEWEKMILPAALNLWK